MFFFISLFPVGTAIAPDRDRDDTNPDRRVPVDAKRNLEDPSVNVPKRKVND